MTHRAAQAAGGADQRLEAAIDLLGRRRYAEATALARQVLAAGERADAVHVVAVAAAQAGDLEGGLAEVERAIRLDPTEATFHNSRGNMLRRRGDAEAALAAFRRAVELDPGYAHGWYNLGIALAAEEDHAAAEAAYRRALEIEPDEPRFLQNLGVVLLRRSELAAAEECFRRVLARSPEEPGALNNLAAARLAEGDVDGALDAFRRAVAAHPGFEEANQNLAFHHADRGEVGAMIEAFRRACEGNPHRVGAQFNLAVGLLVAGRFAEGWRHYEWRFGTGGTTPRRADWPQPVWDGSPLAGRRLAIASEQGFGDMIHFVRYTELVRRHGGVPIVETRPQLERLFATCPWVGEQFRAGSPPPAFDLQVPLASLPLLFATDLDTIPATVPYLSPAREVAPEVEAALAAAEGSFKVGVAWAGRRGEGDDPDRTIPLAALAPLAALPGVTLFGIQFGHRAAALADHPELGIVDLAPWLGDFHRTAGVVSRLDLVITADASPAHLAGAIGHPVWTLLKRMPDWRWLLDRDDTPWYPTMRLFRQRAAGDWGELVERVAAALAAEVEVRRRGGERPAG